MLCIQFWTYGKSKETLQTKITEVGFSHQKLLISLKHFSTWNSLLKIKHLS